MDNLKEARLTKNRMRTVRAILVEYYPQFAEIPKETALQLLLDAEYLSRKGRWLTEGEEKTTKTILSQEFVEQEVI